MNAFEKLIREALARQDTSSAQLRAKIYASARNALDRTLRERPEVTAQMIAKSRQNLEATIRSIEEEYVPRTPVAEAPPVAAPVAPATPVPSPTAPPPVQAPEPAATRAPLSGLSVRRDPDPVAPRVPVRQTPPMSAAPSPTTSIWDDDPEETTASAPEVPSVSAPEQKQADIVPPVEKEMGVDPARKGRIRSLLMPKRFYSWLLSFCLLAAFFVIAGYWVMTSGILEPAAQRDTSVPNPPGTTASGAAYDERDWDAVFLASSPENLTALGANDARLVETLDGDYLKMTFAGIATGEGDFQIAIDRDILQTYAGQRILIDFAMAGNDQPVSIAVECDFNVMGDCGRKRYTVPLQPASMVFSVQLPNIAPEGPGILRVAGVGEDYAGAAVRLFSVRINGEEN